jgi:hypothetical protein
MHAMNRPSVHRHPARRALAAALVLAHVNALAAPALPGHSPRDAAKAAAALAAQAIGAHTLLGQEDGSGANPAVTASIATQASGSSFIAFSAGYTSNTNGPTDNKGNAWPMLGSAVVYNGFGGAFNVKAYLVLGGVGGSGHAVTVVKNSVPTGEITIPFIEVRDATVLQDVAQNYPTGSQLTSGSVTTTGPAVLVAFWWGDSAGLMHSAVPDNGFTIIENFVNLPPGSAVQCVVAFREVASAGTYNVTWTQSDTGAPLWLFAFESGGTIFASGFEG